MTISMYKLPELMPELVWTAPQQPSGLSRKDYKFPASITPRESESLVELLQKHNAKSCLELCTGFGVSTAYIASVCDLVVTVDAYLEEQYHDPLKYSFVTYEEWKQKNRSDEPDGLVCAKRLAELFGVQDKIEFHIGWIPDDVDEICNGRQFDAYFIDALHTPQHFLQCLEFVKYVRPGGLLIVHDYYEINPFIRLALESAGLTDKYRFKHLVDPPTDSWGLAYCVLE